MTAAQYEALAALAHGAHPPTDKRLTWLCDDALRTRVQRSAVRALEHAGLVRVERVVTVGTRATVQRVLALTSAGKAALWELA